MKHRQQPKPDSTDWQSKIIAILCLVSTIFCSNVYGQSLQVSPKGGGLAVLTNTNVKTSELNLSSLRAIFTIRKRNWDDNTPIKVFVLADQNQLHQEFCKTVLKVYPYVLREQWDRLIFSGTGIPPTVVATEQELRRIISVTPGAIGYSMADDNQSLAILHPHPVQLIANRRQ